MLLENLGMRRARYAASRKKVEMAEMKPNLDACPSGCDCVDCKAFWDEHDRIWARIRDVSPLRSKMISDMILNSMRIGEDDGIYLPEVLENIY